MRETLFLIPTLFFVLTCLSVPTGFAQSGDSDYIVRAIYFLPRGTPPQPNIDTELDVFLKESQRFYADEMERHGFGRKTFRFETDRRGNTVVHHVNGRFKDAHYQDQPVTEWAIWEEIDDQFDRSQSIYLVAISISTGLLNGNACGTGTDYRAGGVATIPASGNCFNFKVTAHELGHAFGLEHDFHSDLYLMGRGEAELSPSHAEWLNVSRYFNGSRQPDINYNTEIEISPPAAAPPYAVRLRFAITDPDGLHQAQLQTEDYHDDPTSSLGGLLDFQSLSGRSDTVEFVTTELVALRLRADRNIPVWLHVIDVDGNFIGSQRFTIGIPDLPRGEGVSIPDANLAAVIRGTLELKPRDRITQLDMLRLISLEAENRQITDLTGIEHAKNLKSLKLGENRIRDITPLTGLTQLKFLRLQQNQISDITPIVGLPYLIELNLAGNQITDSRPLAGLTQLRSLVVRVEPVEGGPKIEGPWLWMIAPTGQSGGKKAAASGVDYLARTSGGTVTEQQVAIEGVTPEDEVGNKVWTLGKLSPTGEDNINAVMNTIGLGSGNIEDHVAYGSIVLGAVSEQKTWMYVGSDDAVKVWLNGTLVHNNPIDRGADDYQESFPVTLKQGKNILLVAVYELWGGWSGFFGFENGAAYSILLPPTVHIGPTQRPPMYWIDTEAGTLHRLVGDAAESFLPRVQNATGLVLEPTRRKMYWTEDTGGDTGAVKSANLDGSNVQLLATLQSVPTSIAVHAANGKLYWTNSRGRIQQANLNGQHIRNLIENLKDPGNITLDAIGRKIYWTEDKARIRRANLNGKSIQNIANDVESIGGIAISDNRIYWTESTGENSGKLSRANLNGSNLGTLAELQHAPCCVAVDPVGSNLYWTDVDGNIRRSNLNGQNVEDVASSLASAMTLVLGSVGDNPAAPMNSALVFPDAVAPATTHLLTNYPNPFNPETWIPYQLAEPTDVRVTIYDIQGRVVRYLDLGHQRAGIYQNKGRAAYWDGRNAHGEPVASGVYFYTLKAGDFSATLKMLIRK